MSRTWTDEQKRMVREMYEDHFASEIAELTGKSVSSVYWQARKMGLKASAEKKSRSGRMSMDNPNCVATRFQKGHTPPNKGKPMSPEMYEKAKGTMFKKGHAPVNYRPVGSERISVDGYVEVKVADPGTWRLKHRVVWEEANGPIPRGCNIQFRNGNRQDVRLENLYLISRGEQLAKENSFHARYPEELKTVIRLKASIKRKITEYKRKHDNGKECESRDAEGTPVRGSRRTKESQ